MYVNALLAYYCIIYHGYKSYKGERFSLSNLTTEMHNIYATLTFYYYQIMGHLAAKFICHRIFALFYISYCLCMIQVTGYFLIPQVIRLLKEWSIEPLMNHWFAKGLVGELRSLLQVLIKRSSMSYKA